MKILIDENLPRKLALADSQFDVLLTLDKNLPFQQDLGSVRIAVLILRARSNRIQDLLPVIPDCLDALKSIRPGQVVASAISIPAEGRRTRLFPTHRDATLAGVIHGDIHDQTELRIKQILGLALRVPILPRDAELNCARLNLVATGWPASTRRAASIVAVNLAPATATVGSERTPTAAAQDLPPQRPRKAVAK